MSLLTLTARRLASPVGLHSGSASMLSSRMWFSHQTGTVKFYMRRKAFGFIEPDGEDQKDVFIHREGIVSHADPKKNPYNPYLREGERVRYELNDTENGPRAADVTFESGTEVPLFREDYMVKQTKAFTDQLGFDVFKILSNKDSSPEEHMEEVMKCFGAVESKIEEKLQVINNHNDKEASQATDEANAML